MDKKDDKTIENKVEVKNKEETDSEEDEFL